jgi:hypothetical protein
MEVFVSERKPERKFSWFKQPKKTSGKHLPAALLCALRRAKGVFLIPNSTLRENARGLA